MTRGKRATERVPPPVEEWDDDLKLKFAEWADLTMQLGIKLPPYLQISQFCEAHGIARETFIHRDKRGRTPATVQSGPNRRLIPIQEWIRYDMETKAREDANPFTLAVAIARRGQIADQHASNLRNALQAAADAQTVDTVIDQTFIAEMAELDRLAWQANPDDALAQKQLKEARAGIFASAQARWEARQKARQS